MNADKTNQFTFSVFTGSEVGQAFLPATIRGTPRIVRPIMRLDVYIQPRQTKMSAPPKQLLRRHKYAAHPKAFALDRRQLNRQNLSPKETIHLIYSNIGI
jgi:hypothetical protein